MLFDRGVPVAVSSDDPLPFFTSIEREYRLLVDEFGFNRDELRDMTIGAAEASFLPDDERALLISRIEEGYLRADHPAGETA
jgi:adenosine deaminase